MLFTLAGMVISVKPEPLNALPPMLSSRESVLNVTEVKLVVPENALSPMLFTLAGMVIEVKLDAPWNALAPMLLREEFGANVTEAKLVAPSNALSTMVVTPEPISTLVNDAPEGTG